jgi:hypothetical protein
MERAAQTLAEAQKRIAAAREKNATTTNLGETLQSLAERMGFHGDLQALSKLCSEIGLPVSQALIDRAMYDTPQTAREISALANTVEAELKSKLFFFVPSHRASYLQDDRLSPAAREKFPHSTMELRRAGVCYAFGEYTSAVFHAMRAAEVCVRVLATAIGVSFAAPIEQMDWQIILNAIAGRIKEIGNKPKSQERKADLEFFGPAAAQLQFFKDGWRARASHAGELFQESQARDAIDHVRMMIEILTKRLSENP